MKSKLFILAFGFICFFISLNRINDWKGRMFQVDMGGYHLYLTSAIIYQDIKKLDFYDEINKKYQIYLEQHWFVQQLENGNKANKYTIGTSLHELPFFLIAHAYSLASGTYTADGYSLPYEWASILATIFWACIGLYFLQKLLNKYYNEWIVLFVITSIAVGTNLYYYAAFEQGMSHPYSFFHFSLLLYLTDKWHENFQSKYLLAIALLLGIIAITRVTNTMAAIIPLLWGINNKKYFVEKYRKLFSNYPTLILAAFLFFFVLSIQLIYWKYVSGNWILYSYGEERFIWSKPEIINGLFSFRKGWYIYTPIAILGTLGIFLMKKTRAAQTPIFIFFILFIYITFCWWNWWYGCSFGSRPMVETLALLALPLASFYEYISIKKRAIKVLTSSAVAFLILLNLFQSYQKSIGVIHCDRMSFKYYISTFGQLKADQSKEGLLYSEDKYWEDMSVLDKDKNNSK